MRTSWTRGEKCDILALKAEAVVPVGIKTRRKPSRKHDDLTEAGRVRQQEIIEETQKWEEEEKEKTSKKAAIKKRKGHHAQRSLQTCEPCKEQGQECDHAQPTCTRCIEGKIQSRCVYKVAGSDQGNPDSSTPSPPQTISQSGKSKAKSKGKVGGEGKNKTSRAVTRSEKNHEGPDHPTRLPRAQRSGKVVTALDKGTIDEEHHTTESVTHRMDPGAETQCAAVIQDTDNNHGDVLRPIETNGRSKEHLSKSRDSTSKDLLSTFPRSSIRYYFTAKEKTGITKASVISSRDDVEALLPTPTKVGPHSQRKRKLDLSTSSEEEESIRIRTGKKRRLAGSTTKVAQ